MKINLEINDSKAQAFLEFLKTLDYVKINENTEVDFAIPDWHKSMVQERLESYKKNPKNTSNFGDTINKFKK